jgi:hypothetical protein
MADHQLKERDAMICRACAKEERASEGYPCADCGTFICTICSMKGVTKCERCSRGGTPSSVRTNTPGPLRLG